MADDFDPDAYLSKTAFDPDQYLKSTAQPIGALEGAVKPITDIPSTYMQMVGQAKEQMGRGVGQIESLQPWEMAKGVGNVALGGLSYLGAPINAPLHTLVGEPVERATGSPLAGQVAEAGAGFALPIPHAPRGLPELPVSPYGVTLTRGEQLGDLAMRQKEQGALRAQEHPVFAEQREAQLAAARENLARGLSPQGELVAETPGQAGELVSQGIRAEAGGARNTVQSLYETARTMPGEIDSSAFQNMTGGIRNDLSAGDNPVVIDRGTTPNAAKMMDYLEDQVAGLNIENKAAPGFLAPAADDSRIAGVNLTGIDQWRKNLSGMRKDAFGSSMPGQVNADARASQAVLDAFDRHIDGAVNSNLFSGDQGAIDAWNNARQAYSDYRRTFTAGRNDPVGRAMQKIVGDPVNDPLTPGKVIDSIVGAQGATGSVPLANRIRTVLGEQSPEWTAVKQGALQKLITPGEGERDFGVAQQAQRLSKFLNGDMAGAIYSPAEQATLRGYANFMRDLTMPAGSFSPSEPAIRKLATAVGTRISSVLGFAVGEALLPGHPFIGGLTGAETARYAAAVVGKYLNGMRSNFPVLADAMRKYSVAQSRTATASNPLAQRAAVGATLNLQRVLAPMGIDMKEITGPAPATAKDQERVPGPDQQRKTGGRVKQQKGLATKSQAHYRGGNAHWACAWCTMFVKPSSCTSVRGHISPRALCDFYEPEKGHERLVDNKHDVVTGANSSKKPNGTIFIDRHIPEWSPKLRTKDGKRVRLWTYLSVHEDEEQRLMEEEGETYDKAHEAATLAEQKKAEADGVNWAAYTKEIDKYLEPIEREKADMPPEQPLHVKPEAALKGEGHHHSTHKRARRQSGGGVGDEDEIPGWSSLFPTARTPVLTMTPAQPQLVGAPQTGAAGVVSPLASAVRQAYRSLGGGGDAVRLNTLRAALPSIPRDQLDAALLSMRKSGEGVLMNLDNPRDIASVGDAALKSGSSIYHTLWLDPNKAP